MPQDMISAPPFSAANGAFPSSASRPRSGSAGNVDMNDGPSKPSEKETTFRRVLMSGPKSSVYIKVTSSPASFPTKQAKSGVRASDPGKAADAQIIEPRLIIGDLE